MDKFQIVEVTEQLNHAGTKATADIALIAERLGFKPVKVKMDSTRKTLMGKVVRQIGYFRDWSKAEREISDGSVLLLQHPFHYPQFTREKSLRAIKNKNVKIISVVHDVEELRAFRYNDYYKHEFEFMLEISDVLIVHNDVMKQWFMETGVKAEKLVTLEIFDYLQKEDTEKKISFEKSITVAGNLDTEKCGYIKELGMLQGIKVHLYGPNFDEGLRNTKDIEYHGSFPAVEIPKKLDRGFGLVWDGESIRGCKGASGQYLRYNNPHKLSLYLSSGIPVIIWKEAAEAGFVEKNKVGITVQSVEELEKIFETLTIEEYEIMVDNVSKISTALCNGKYGETAIKESLRRIGDN